MTGDDPSRVHGIGATGVKTFLRKGEAKTFLRLEYIFALDTDISCRFFEGFWGRTCFWRNLAPPPAFPSTAPVDLGISTSRWTTCRCTGRGWRPDRTAGWSAARAGAGSTWAPRTAARWRPRTSWPRCTSRTGRWAGRTGTPRRPGTATGCEGLPTPGCTAPSPRTARPAGQAGRARPTRTAARPTAWPAPVPPGWTARPTRCTAPAAWSLRRIRPATRWPSNLRTRRVTSSMLG